MCFEDWQVVVAERTMKLPNAAQARVDREKITEYLLSLGHPDGRSKAEFFSRFGFRLQDWRLLQQALRRHVLVNDVVQVVESIYGERYTVEGPLETPGGRQPLVRSVWILEAGASAPRLITAYPVRGEHAERT